MERVGSQNAVVVAQTGVGKSLVAAEIIDKALRRRPSGCNRVVVYLENQRPLVKQQSEKLIKYFRKQGQENADFVGSYVGGDFIPCWEEMQKCHSVIVCTAAIFLGKLEDGQAKVDDCILICFDECHSSIKEHPFHKVNQEVKRIAASQPGAQLPQILGLTATPSWEDDVEGNFKALAQLCDNMNSAVLVQVTENVEELAEHTHTPDVDQKHPLQARGLDVAYKNALPDAMEELEEALSAAFGLSDAARSLKAAAKDLRRERLATAQSTAGFSKNYDVVAKKWLDEATLADCVRAKVCLRLACAINQLYPVVDDVGWESAQCLLGSALFRALEDAASAEDERDVCLEVIKRLLMSTLCQSEFVTPLLSVHPLASSRTRAATGTDCYPPKLAELAKCLLDSCEGEERSLRGIVFVQTRAAARRVVNFLKMHHELKAFVRPAVFCGHTEMSTKAQEKVMRAFEVNQFNVLVSTSVLHEGFDIPDIWLAVMLDGVSSGKVSTQCRGRIMRCKGGAFHVFYFRGSSEATGVWRSEQQERASTKALREMADSGKSMGEFARLSIGSNPLMQLNKMKQERYIVRGPDLEPEPRRDPDSGEWEVTVFVTLHDGQTVRKSAKHRKKDSARLAAATEVVMSLISPFGESV